MVWRCGTVECQSQPKEKKKQGDGELSSTTSTLMEKIAEVENAIRKARELGTDVKTLEEQRQGLVKQLTEANNDLERGELLKG